MGLPTADEWPVGCPIAREAFENHSQSLITLDRLIRFQDTCAFELLRVCRHPRACQTLTLVLFIRRHYYRSNKAFVQRLFERLNTTFSAGPITRRAQSSGRRRIWPKQLLLYPTSIVTRTVTFFSIMTTIRRLITHARETIISTLATITIDRGRLPTMVSTF